MAGCFFTPDQIDQMPMQDVMALFTLWREVPPTHEILAAVHRVTTPTPKTSQDRIDDPSGIGALIARAPDGHLKAAL